MLSAQQSLVVKKVEPEVDKKVVRVELGGVRQDTQENNSTTNRPPGPAKSVYFFGVHVLPISLSDRLKEEDEEEEEEEEEEEQDMRFKAALHGTEGYQPTVVFATRRSLSSQVDVKSDKGKSTQVRRNLRARKTHRKNKISGATKEHRLNSRHPKVIGGGRPKNVLFFLRPNTLLVLEEEEDEEDVDEDKNNLFLEKWCCKFHPGGHPCGGWLPVTFGLCLRPPPPLALNLNTWQS